MPAGSKWSERLSHELQAGFLFERLGYSAFLRIKNFIANVKQISAVVWMVT